MPSTSNLFLAFLGLTCFRCLEVLNMTNQIDGDIRSQVIATKPSLSIIQPKSPALRATPTVKIEEQSNQKPRSKTGSTRTSSVANTKRKVDTFSWKDVSTTIQKPRCGNEKCFYASKSDPEGKGYIISSALRSPGIWRAWHISQSIDKILKTPSTKSKTVVRDDSIFPQSRHHFYFDEPIQKNSLPRHIVKVLGKKRLGKARALMIQIVDVAPIDDLAILGCSPSRVENSWNELTKVIFQTGGAVGENMEDSKDTTTWDNEKEWVLSKRMVKAVNTFRQSVDNTFQVLEAHPGLVADFQIFVNDMGHIFHYDLDRGRIPPPQPIIDQCRCNLQAMVGLLEQVVETMGGETSHGLNDQSYGRTTQLVLTASKGSTKSLLEYSSTRCPA